VNFDVPPLARRLRAPHRAHGRVGRKGRAITFVEPRQQKELSRSRTTPACRSRRGSRAPRSRPAAIEVKPQAALQAAGGHRDADEEFAKLIAACGRADGVEVADLVSAVTPRAALDGEAVRDVEVLERFSLLSVPAGDADRSSPRSPTRGQGPPLTPSARRQSNGVGRARAGPSMRAGRNISYARALKVVPPCTREMTTF
jgi:ATP-dependent RNA helicase DeaD